MGVSLLDLTRRAVYVPWTRIPEGAVVELPGRGSTYVADVPGPSEDAPVVVLLHALGCTGLLTWFPVIHDLARRFRVVTLDQRCHGQGVWTDDLRLTDCADDVAALLDVLDVDEALVAGYSLGSIVAQRVWRQHPDRVAGLVLCASTDRFQRNPAERLFFSGMGTSMHLLRAASRSDRAAAAARTAARRLDLLPSDMHEWALREFRSTRPRGIAQALAALGRHHSRPWLGRIDVPTAVVVMTRDHVVPTRRQYALARAIPGATVHEVADGHAGVVLGAERFGPAFAEAVATVRARSRDFAR